MAEPVVSGWTDHHCHLPADGAAELVAEALRGGVTRLVDVGTTVEASREANDLSGFTGDFKQMRSRVDNLRAISGCLRLEVTGEQGFAFRVRFGAGQVPETPHTQIRVSPEVYDELREGRLDAQNAFMGGQLEVTGVLQIAMQLAAAWNGSPARANTRTRSRCYVC